MPNVEDGSMVPALRTEPSDALYMVWCSIRFRKSLRCLRERGGGRYALGAHIGHFHGCCLGVHRAWTFESQDLVVHSESVSGSVHMVHTVSSGEVGGLYPPSASVLLRIVCIALLRVALVVCPRTERLYLAFMTHSVCMIARSHGKQFSGMAFTHSQFTGKCASVYSSTRGPGTACSLFSGIQ